ncbi:MAG: hypothetical protein IJ109_07600 [Firmicutes bacterium]|nr:hypothetical protein [Bacillota bacterium]
MKRTARKVIALVMVLAMIQGTSSAFSFAQTAPAGETAEPAVLSEEPITATGDLITEEPEQDSGAVQEETPQKPDPADNDTVIKKEEVTAASAKESAAPQKQEYRYSDSRIEATAVLSDAAAIPDDAQLVVTPVTARTQGYNYEAYLSALNAKAGQDAAYTDANTLLYDIAFMAGSEEIQPAEGVVDVTVTFKKDQLSKDLDASSKDDVQLLHLPLKENARNDYRSTAEATNIEASDVSVETVDADIAVGKTESTAFELNSFSIISVSTNPDKFGSADQTNSQVNYELALGRAVEYGIVADTYDQKNHQQTNFAVKTFKNSGQINGEPDLAGTSDVPYQIGEVALNKLRFGTNTYQGKEVQYDVYLPKTYENSINNYVQIDGGGKNKVNLVYEEEDTIKKNIQSMLDGARSKSQLMADHATTIDLTNDVVTDQNQLVVDTTSYADDAVIYLNIPDTSNYSMIRTVIGMQSSFHLHKKENQVIVVNVLGTSDVNLKKMIVTLEGEDKNTKSDEYSSFSPSGQNAAVNDRIDKQIAQKVIWNIPEASKVTMDTSAGVFLVPNGSVEVTGTSAGWIVSGGTVTTDGCEFHYVYRERQYKPQTMAGVSRYKIHSVQGDEGCQ